MSETLVLTYHSIDPSGSAISTSPAEFEQHLGFLRRRGYESISLLDAVRALEAGEEVAERTVIITFDDGYRNNLMEAEPILRQFGYSATVFVATGYCGADNAWGDQHSSIPRLPMMTHDELRQIRDAGIEVGAHTRTHPRLSEISLSKAREEMEGSKSDLEAIVGEKIETFSYPYGDFNGEVREIASALFKTAIGNRPGKLTNDSDLFAIDRINACGKLFRTMPIGLSGLWSFRGYLSVKKLIDYLSANKA